LDVQLRHFATPAKPAAAAPAGGKAPAKGGAAAKGGAGKKKAGKESKLGNTLTAGSTGFAVGEKMPIGIFKEAQDPVVKQDKEYPDWLWKVHELPTLNDSIKIVAKEMEEGKVNVQLAKRINRLKRNVSSFKKPAGLFSLQNC
jgi:hypothetical protein